MRSEDNRSQTLKGFGVPAWISDIFLQKVETSIIRASGYNGGEEWGTRSEEINQVFIAIQKEHEC